MNLIYYFLLQDSLEIYEKLHNQRQILLAYFFRSLNCTQNSKLKLTTLLKSRPRIWQPWFNWRVDSKKSQLTKNLDWIHLSLLLSKMIDFFAIFSKGGIVLWCFQRTSEIFTSSVNALIKAVILQVVSLLLIKSTICCFNHMILC